MSGGTVPGVPGGDAERQRAQYRPVLCPVYGSGWETKVRSGEDGGTVGAGERRKREPEGRRLKRQGPGRKMPGGTVPGIPAGMRNGSTHSTEPNSARRAGEAGRRGQKRKGRQNGRSWGAAEAGAGGAKAEATGAGQKDAGRDRSRGAGRGCGTVVRIERIRALSGVRERLGDEDSRGKDGRTAGAAETGAGGAKGQGPDRKMPGRGRRGQKKAGRNREQGFGWPVRKLIFDGGSRQGVDSGAAGS